ncbi:potassium channel family protein [Micromonospora echinofusca]|uniref:TrkA family potassium uptake protein n=1 Tax=Micromonospora echinofusca TaxID=47858 RepID=A0ABS3VTF9_MICEH|nr:TrkA family potassium uptake protein [Micromonospora echinofusca]MBO4207803.1 TrkA family potassium uptake protein [Micromonospora echinofusca]
MSARRRPGPEESGVAVIGLGRFGWHVSQSLTALGYDVLAVDENPRIVQRWSDQLSRVVQADATDEKALRQLGLTDFGRVVVAIGASVEASVLVVLALAELGVPEIWARATSEKHAKILDAVGADHVVFPEAATGERVAHLIVSKMLDFIEFDEDFAIAKVRAPQALQGRPIGEIAISDRYGVVVVGAKQPGQKFRYTSPDTVLVPGSVLIVEGTISQVQRFAEMT